MIWSIMPEEYLFAANDNEEQQIRSCSYQGRKLLIRPLGGGEGEIISLLSTDPEDFLDPRFQAGRIMTIND